MLLSDVGDMFNILCLYHDKYTQPLLGPFSLLQTSLVQSNNPDCCILVIRDEYVILFPFVNK